VSVVAQDHLGPVVHAGDRWFYISTASVAALVAFVGFAPTYWLPLATGTLDIPRVVHVHGIVLFAWTLFFVMQATLVASGQTLLHRRTGVLGVALAIAVTLTGVVVTGYRLNADIALGLAHESRAFAIVPLSSVAFFAGVIALAIANVRRPAVHKRLMVVGTFSILQPAIARWTILALAPADAVGPPPVMVTMLPALIVILMLLTVAMLDRKRHGRLHPVYVYGMLAFVALQVLRVLASESAAWHAFCGWFAGVMA
jgi:hypothetical protein